jgi:nicotinate-nucleotide--dimethylbenzimidazole phosphoribosyltransferase
MLPELGVEPILHLEMRLGEGTGACIAMGLIEAAVKLMREMATFETAAISGKRE